MTRTNTILFRTHTLRTAGLSVVAAITLLGGHGLAAQGMGGSGGMGGGLMAADADKDGKITRAEAQAMAKQRFAQMDIDKDGKLTKADREAAQAARKEAGQSDGKKRRAGAKRGGGMGQGMGGRMPSDMTEAEFEAQTMERFGRADMNSDGVIDAAEIETIRQMMGSMGGQGGGFRGQPEG